MEEFYLKHEKIVDILLFVLAFLMIYTSGRLHQKEADQQALNEQVQKYQTLQEEYQEYKRNSYVLYGHEWYKEKGLLP